MPELPEVESLKLSLENKILRNKILSCEVLKPKIISGHSTKREANKKATQNFKKSIEGREIKKINRIAKNLIFEFENKSILIIHLKMTGQLVFENKKKEKTLGGHPIIESYKNSLPNKHTCIIFTLDKGKLFYNDVRMFGYVLYYKNYEEAIKSGHFQNIGIDPFDKRFTLTYFKNELKKKNKSIKSVLLEQTVVSGSGNIYTDEICFASKVLPNRLCKKLSAQEMSLLYKNIKKILTLAIKHKGSSVSNYLLADGTKGNYAHLHKVYGKAGKECKICKSVLQKEKIAGRTTVFCPTCQK